VHAERVFQQAGLFRPVRPDKLARTLIALRRWGPDPAAAFAFSAVHFPNETALVDELTFEQVQHRTNGLARGLAEHGIGPRHGVAIMCRDHRRFIEATIALSKLIARPSSTRQRRPRGAALPVLEVLHGGVGAREQLGHVAVLPAH
jgi:non-ribosomal peptide synthetase component F